MKHIHRWQTLLERRTALAVLVILGGACSSSPGASQGTGGAAGPGAGGVESGGGTSGEGGAAGSGGLTGSTDGSGGASTSTGVSGTGGRQGSGGAGTQGQGGATGVGGSRIDAGRDARPGTGGAVDAAVDTTPGSGGSAGSDGCVSGKTTSSCSKSGGTKCTMTVNGKTREYYLILPTTYDPGKPYPVVVELHGMIATAEMALNWFKDIPKSMPDAIYIAPQGLKHAEQGGGANGQEVTGWANVDGEDIQFMKDLVSTSGKDYCVDSERVFAVGFSYGGMMSYAIGCELGGIFRAVAPMSGALLSGCNLGGKPVAMWGAHGINDSMVSITMGRQARDKILKQNHCGSGTSPVDPSPCVTYQGCDDGYPVTWCEWDGDHNIPSFGSSAVAAFFKQF